MGAERYSGTEDARKECILYCDSKTENSDKSVELTSVVHRRFRGGGGAHHRYRRRRKNGLKLFLDSNRVSFQFYHRSIETFSVHAAISWANGLSILP